MTKQIDRNIRALKTALVELNNVTDDYYVISESTPFNTLLFSDHLDESKHHIRLLITDLEDKYQKIHQIGSHISRGY